MQGEEGSIGEGQVGQMEEVGEGGVQDDTQVIWLPDI